MAFFKPFNSFQISTYGRVFSTVWLDVFLNIKATLHSVVYILYHPVKLRAVCTCEVQDYTFEFKEFFLIRDTMCVSKTRLEWRGGSTVM